MLKVNGEKIKYREGMTVTDVIHAMKFNFPLLIVKVDGVYIPRDEYGNRQVPDGSDVEIIHLISGG
ncbi:MAG: sulfur carrier protein ThiS [Candidatus Riflebacteria bacterium]|nr:sulfur carrier protein ThiS [Candidatus Riflebacteria bacterium]